jgi:membrane protease subunit HflK
MDFIITEGRSDVAQRIRNMMQSILDRYQAGLAVISFNMQDAQAPEQVQGAFADAVKAREDEQRLKNEAEAYANDVIPKARGQAARLIEESNAYREQVIAVAEGETARFLSVLAQYEKAPEVTRKRLYLETMESVMGQSSKVLVDTKDSNNLLYLPLDKLMQRDGLPGSGMGSSPSMSTPVPPDQSPRTDIRLRENLRQREVR